MGKLKDAAKESTSNNIKDPIRKTKKRAKSPVNDEEPTSGVSVGEKGKKRGPGKKPLGKYYETYDIDKTRNFRKAAAAAEKYDTDEQRNKTKASRRLFLANPHMTS